MEVSDEFLFYYVDRPQNVRILLVELKLGRRNIGFWDLNQLQ